MALLRLLVVVGISTDYAFADLAVGEGVYFSHNKNEVSAREGCV